mgnify:CR=1 FL=1
MGDGPVQFDYGGAPEPWRVDNFDGDDYGTIDLRGAVVDSVNTAFAQLAIALGLDRITNMATRLGSEQDPDRAIDVVLEQIGLLLAADNVTMFLWDAEGQVLRRRRTGVARVAQSRAVRRLDGGALGMQGGGALQPALAHQGEASV